MEDYWKFLDWIVRRGRCTKFVNFKVKCQPKMEFSEERRGTKSLHKGGGGGGEEEYTYFLEQFTYG